MTRIASAFARRNDEGKKALITYLCVGDPNERESVDLALACVDAGADILELGCPFSDPTADGPAIARASERARAGGGGLEMTLRVARAIRDRSEAPIVLFGYYNPLFVRGETEAVRLAAEAGVDALLVVDLPTDESESLRAATALQHLSVVPLIAPTSPRARVEALREVAVRHVVPFVYYVSSTGVTGSAAGLEVLDEAARQAARVREITSRPTVVGFGIDSAERAAIVVREADGVVVGSAIVRCIEKETSAPARIEAVKDLVRELRSAV